MTYSHYITRSLVAGLWLSLSQASLAQNTTGDSDPITDQEIANAVAQYEALLAKEQALTDAQSENLSLQNEVFQYETAQDLSIQSVQTLTSDKIDIETFRDIVIARAKEQGATAQFILDSNDTSKFLTLHDGIETDFHLTNVYLDYAESPHDNLETAIETIVFLILSTEKNRFTQPDEATELPWIAPIQDNNQENDFEDISVELLPDHTK